MLPAQAAAAHTWNSLSFGNLSADYNLISDSVARTPSEFNVAMSPSPPAPGVVTTTHAISIWGWDAANEQWYFYSPSLESSGGFPAVCAYALAHFYRCADTFQLGVGTGFWVQKP